MGAVNNTRNALRNVQIMHDINVGVVHLFSMSVQHTVNFEHLRLSSKRQSLQRVLCVEWAVDAVRQMCDFRVTLFCTHALTCIRLSSQPKQRQRTPVARTFHCTCFKLGDNHRVGFPSNNDIYLQHYQSHYFQSRLPFRGSVKK